MITAYCCFSISVGDASWSTKKSELKSIVEHSGFVIVELVGKIEIFGLNDLDEITSVTCNDQQAQFSKDPDAKVSSVV